MAGIGFGSGRARGAAIPHDTDLILILSVALPLAFVMGFIAMRLRLPAIVGYLITGILVGPFTPGVEADAELAPQLAEIGVILLMFGVGIHFSLRDLMDVRKVAIPGAVVQSTVATLLAVGITQLWGWDVRSGIVVGFALSVASTVVLLRALIDADLLDTAHGKVAVGWLIVEDLFTVLALVFLPMLAHDSSGDQDIAMSLVVTMTKVVVLVVGVLWIGAKLVPLLLVQVSRTGSRELFTLAVLAIAFGIAFGSAQFFGVSMALGAFLAGLVMGDSDLSHRAAEENLPMRNAFSVLFFISVGMLFDPAILIEEPIELVLVVAIVMIGKPLAAFALVGALGHPARTGLVVGAGLAQIGEFSFILAEMGRGLDLLPDEGYSLILAAAIVSITLNPMVFHLIPVAEAFLRRRRGEPEDSGERSPPEEAYPPPMQGHVVLCGYGRVGGLIAEVLDRAGTPYIVVERDRGRLEPLRARGIPVVQGDAVETSVQNQLSLADARLLILAVPDPFAVRRMAEVGRELQPGLPIVARTHSAAEWRYLEDGRVDDTVLAEYELGRAMVLRALHHLGLEWDDRSEPGVLPLYDGSSPASLQ